MIDNKQIEQGFKVSEEALDISSISQYYCIYYPSFLFHLIMSKLERDRDTPRR
jgi:hypothetical protein